MSQILTPVKISQIILTLVVVKINTWEMFVISKRTLSLDTYVKYNSYKLMLYNPEEYCVHINNTVQEKSMHKSFTIQYRYKQY